MSEVATEVNTSGARRGRPGYDQDTLLQVCVRVFNEHGYHATSMGMLAEALGISKSAIYHHVRSKEELLALSLNRALSSLDGVTVTARETPGTAHDRLEVLIRGTVEVLVRERPHVTLLLRLRENSDVERHAMNERRRLTKELEKRFEFAQEEGGIRSDVSPRIMARTVFGAINSMIDWYRPEKDDAERIAQELSTLFFDGLNPRA